MLITEDEQRATRAEQMDLERLGATANNAAFLANPDTGVDYNVFVDAWNWLTRHFKKKPSDTCR